MNKLEMKLTEVVKQPVESKTIRLNLKTIPCWAVLRLGFNVPR